MTTADERFTILLAGGGETGLATAKELRDRGQGVVLVERDPDRCRVLADEYVATVVCGDATDPETLAQAEPDRCDAVVALTGDTATNVLVCSLCAEVVAVPTIARVGPGVDADDLDGVDRIVPNNATGVDIGKMILQSLRERRSGE